MNPFHEEEASAAWEAKANALWELQNWRQLKSLTDAWLSAAPNASLAHYYAGVAKMSLGDLPQMGLHARVLLEQCPEWLSTHDLACRYWMKRETMAYALFHAQQMIRLEPDSPWGYYFAAAATYSPKTIGTANAYIQQARQLEPNDASIAHMQLRIEHLMARRGSEARELKARFFEVLRLNPERAASHEALGDFCYGELGDVSQALQSYRHALELEPTDTDCQKKFRVAFRNSSWWLRTVFWHQMILSWIVQAFSNQPLITIYALFLPHLAVAVLMYIVFSAVVLSVPAFFIAAIFFPCSAQAPWMAYAMRRIGFGRLPKWSQCLLGIACTIAFWLAAILLMRSTWMLGVSWIATIIAVNFAWQLLGRVITRARSMRELTLLLVVAAIVGIALFLAWVLGWMPGYEAVLWGIAAAIALAVLQLIAMLFIWRHRRRHRIISYKSARAAPMPG